MHVEIWSDVVCPWCYLGKARFERALADFDHRDEVSVEYRSFELDPTAQRGETVPTVQLLAAKMRMTAAQVADNQRAMEARAAEDGLEFRMDGLLSGSTRDAHRLLHLAKSHGLQTELAERLHRAYFTEQRSIFDHESLTAIAREAGLDPETVTEVLDGDGFAGDVDADVEQAREFGANGVPFFVFDRRFAVSGAQSAETMAQALEQAWEAGASVAS